MTVEGDVFERVRRAIAQTPVATAGGIIFVTVSIGVAGLRSGESSEALISAADAALYRAKAEGRNRVCYAPAEETR